MEMPTGLEASFSDQITLELASSVAYLQMAAWFETENLPGMAHWMRLQSEEERDHALRFLDFALSRGNRAKVWAIEAPRWEFANPAAVFENALDQERRVSEAIRNLYSAANQAGDVESFPLLQWFLSEQVEEEATVEEILGQLRMAGQDGSALLLLDRELGSRAPGSRGIA